MDFAFSDDQAELRTSARRWLADRLPPERLHALADSPDGTDPALWPELAAMGWVGLSGPDGGGSFLDEAVLLEEAGYGLLPAPLLSSVVVLPALVAGGADLGDATALAWAEPAGPGTLEDPEAVSTRAEAAEGGYALTGLKSDVLDLGTSSRAVVLARTPEGPGVFLVGLTTPGVGVRVLATTDRTRRVGALTLESAVAAPLAAGADAARVLTDLRLRGLAAVALDAVGVGQRALDLSAAHAQVREQFGRVIGTYQAVSHRVAEVYVRVELARSLAYRAAWCVATRETEPGAVSDDEALLACASAKAAAGEAAVFACESAIQVLGGIGMTWEHVAHRYYKRALADESYGGAPARLRALVAEAVLVPR